MFNVLEMLSSNDQVFHINYNDQLSSGIVPEERRIIGLGHFKADLVKMLGYLQVTCSRYLLEAIERFFESTNNSWMRTRLKYKWLHHVHLLV